MSDHVQPIMFRPAPQLLRLLGGLVLLGVLALLSAAPLAPGRSLASLLIASLYLVGLGLGAMMFLAADNVIEGGWTAVFRRIPEAMGSLLPVAAIGIGVVLLGGSLIYPWMSAPVEGPTTTALRQVWLTQPFFILRGVIYCAIWIGLARMLVGVSLRQDRDGAIAHTLRNIGPSALALVAFAVTIWLASTDWIMTLEPAWASTIFGVYNFAGLFLSGLAAMTLLVVWLSQGGPLTGLVTAEHYHDLGKLLFSFGCFWFYIWFSQYLIIWYADIPEETAWYLPQLKGAWTSLFVLNLILNWAVPFLVLLAGQTKRHPKVLTIVCVSILFGRWVDLYLMIGRPVFPGGAVVSYLEIGVLLGVVGLAGLIVLRALSRAPLVPLHDPYLEESLHHHQ